MKQTVKNCEVMVTCDTPMNDGEVALGVGCFKTLVEGSGLMRRVRRVFMFEKMVASAPRKHNPRVFKGRWWSVRATQAGFRFTAIFTPEQVAAMSDADLLYAIQQEIALATHKMSDFVLRA